MPDESTKTAEGEKPESAAQAKAEKPKAQSPSADEIVKAVTGKAADSDGPQSRDQEKPDPLKDLESNFSKRLDKAFSAFDKKLKGLEERLSQASRDDLEDEGDQPSKSNPSSAEIEELRQRLAAFETQLTVKDTENKVVAAIANAQKPTKEGQPGLTEEQIGQAWEWLETPEAKMAGFGRHNFQSGLGIRAVAMAAGVFKPVAQGPLGQEREIIGAQAFDVDYKTGKIIKPKHISEGDDLSHLPIDQRVRAKSLAEIDRLTREGLI